MYVGNNNTSIHSRRTDTARRGSGTFSLTGLFKLVQDLWRRKRGREELCGERESWDELVS